MMANLTANLAGSETNTEKLALTGFPNSEAALTDIDLPAHGTAVTQQNLIIRIHHDNAQARL